MHPEQQHLQPEVLPGPLDVVDVPYRHLRHRPGLQIRQDDDPRPLQVIIRIFCGDRIQFHEKCKMKLLDNVLRKSLKCQ